MAKKSKEIWKVDKNVFSVFSERALHKLSSEGHFLELASPITLGKEANIFTALREDEGFNIVKIYRLENANFNKMYEYIAGDPRFQNLKKIRRQIIFAWVQREYRNLLKARELIRVPTPYANLHNIIVMEMIGDSEPALQLKNDIPKDLNGFFNKVIGNVRKLWKGGLVHGDLSEFNILNYKDEPVFIDFSQSTMTTHPNSKDLLIRDLVNICRFFKRPEGEAEKLFDKISSDSK